MASIQEQRVLAAKIERAMSSGPRQITKDATVAEMSADGSRIILRQGTNDWICFPGDENRIGDVPMCADPMGLQWMMDVRARKPKPTNAAPGLVYMLCGATQAGLETERIEESGMNVVKAAAVQLSPVFYRREERSSTSSRRGVSFATPPTANRLPTPGKSPPWIATR